MKDDDLSPERCRGWCWSGGAFVGSVRPDGASPQQPIPKRPDPLAPAMVREFVGKAHANLVGTKALLEEQPALLNATWDWGGGDFETGIGGAGHMGNREIAEFLIGRGARLDVFVAAMLGKIDIVRGMLTAWPMLLAVEGTARHPVASPCARGRGHGERSGRIPSVARRAVRAVMLGPIGQISMNAHDIDRGTTFYAETLGVKLLFRAGELSFFDCGGIRLMLAKAEKPEFDHPGSVLYFKVDDLDATYSTLRARGVTFVGEPHLIARMPDHELWMAFFNDSEGNTLALMSEKR